MFAKQCLQPLFLNVCGTGTVHFSSSLHIVPGLSQCCVEDICCVFMFDVARFDCQTSDIRLAKVSLCSVL